jgi:antitoxin ParD1/3/4
MNVSLTAQLERYVEDKVRTGSYSSASEVIREALRMLQDQDQLRRARLEQLRKEVAIGLAQADRGEMRDGQTVFSELFARNATARRKTR